MKSLVNCCGVRGMKRSGMCLALKATPASRGICLQVNGVFGSVLDGLGGNQRAHHAACRPLRGEMFLRGVQARWRVTDSSKWRSTIFFLVLSFWCSHHRDRMRPRQWHIYVISPSCLTKNRDSESLLRLHDCRFRKSPNHTLIYSSMVEVHRVQLQRFVRVLERSKRDIHVLASVRLMYEAPRVLRSQQVRFSKALQLELRALQKRYGRKRGREL